MDSLWQQVAQQGGTEAQAPGFQPHSSSPAYFHLGTSPPGSAAPFSRFSGDQSTQVRRPSRTSVTCPIQDRLLLLGRCPGYEWSGDLHLL